MALSSSIRHCTSFDAMDRKHWEILVQNWSQFALSNHHAKPPKPKALGPSKLSEFLELVGWADGSVKARGWIKVLDGSWRSIYLHRVSMYDLYACTIRT